MRKFLPMRDDQNKQPIRPILRTDKPAGAYGRRSLVSARDEEKDKSQSREMQTEDIRVWSVAQGWHEKDFHPYFSDFGLSGTLRPDQRPDMLRLFDDIDAGKFDHGTIICYQESRLFRDETQIYYNQFIEKCRQHDIVVVVISPYLMIYDFRDDFLTEMFRWKCKDAADFIKRHVKGWMHPARFRAAWHDGNWAGYGNIPTGFIVDYDEKSPTYKKLIPYWPHAEKKRELRLLFVELGCEISLLFKRLRATPIIFPEFEPWVDARVVNRYQIGRYPGGGYCPKCKGTIVGMLTDVNDIGYRPIKGVIRRDGRGEKILDHEPIIDRELFDLCYYPLAQTDLDGNLIGEEKQRRFFHQHTDDAFGLLKFRITSPQAEEVVTHAHRETPAYIMRSLEGDSLRHYIALAVIPCEELDRLVVDRLMQHARELSQDQEEIAAYEQQASQRRQERQKKLAQIERSIQDIDKAQSGLTRRLGKVEAEAEEAERAGDQEKRARKERLKYLIEEEIGTLEVERLKLAEARGELEEAAEADLGSLEGEIRQLAELWPQYRFGKRRSLINFLVREVVVEIVATHWLRIQVLWLHEEWGREALYYHRSVGGKRAWTEEEEAIAREHYAALPREELMALLPERGWQTITEHCRLKERRREIAEGEFEWPRHLAHSDLQFMRSERIPYSARCTSWVRLY